MKWRQLSEAQIAKAKAQGQFDNLAGAGKPLPKWASSGDAFGFRIMKDAGILPREFELKKEIETLRVALHDAKQAETSPEDITKMQNELFEKMDALAKEEEARRKFMRD